MSGAFAVGLSIGAAIVVFGRDSAAGRRVLLSLHISLARLRRWLGGGR